MLKLNTVTEKRTLKLISRTKQSERRPLPNLMSGIRRSVNESGKMRIGHGKNMLKEKKSDRSRSGTKLRASLLPQLKKC